MNRLRRSKVVEQRILLEKTRKSRGVVIGRRIRALTLRKMRGLQCGRRATAPGGRSSRTRNLANGRFGSFATDRCAMKIGPCPQCPESDDWRQSVVRRDGPGHEVAALQP